MPRPRLITTVVACLALSAAAMARQPASTPTALEPPTLTVTPGNGPGVMPMIWGLLFLGFVLGANLLPVKRGHQD